MLSFDAKGYSDKITVTNRAYHILGELVRFENDRIGINHWEFEATSAHFNAAQLRAIADKLDELNAKEDR